jgi:hypothetical protein
MHLYKTSKAFRLTIACMWCYCDRSCTGWYYRNNHNIVTSTSDHQ